MGNASVSMREVKTRFTLWHNEKHGMVGTFWTERFRRVLVVAYIDLNPVPAGLFKDAGDYGLRGYGEACAGGSEAQRGGAD